MNKFLKRTMDVVGSGAALIALSPVLAGVSVAIRAKLGGPVLFSQTRPGLDGKPFKMYKFRTMTSETDDNGELLPDADRMTPLGQFLRASSLDELPEFFNVLKGEMSLVGPRPLLMEYLGLYSETQARRHEVRPGITGWAQINGRNAISWSDKFDLDIWYVDNRSFAVDMNILLQTVVKVFARSDISQDDHVTAEKFAGNA